MTDDGWQLQDNAADAYEAYLVPAIFRAMSARLVAAADVGPGDRVLDVACGTGVVARTAAEGVGASGAVRGVDINPDMLATARRAAEGVSPRITFQRADAMDLPFDDGAFDVVLCQEALQFLPDRVAALDEMRRVAAPGGRIACSVFRSLEHHPVYRAFAQVLGEHAGADAERMMGSPFALGDADVLRGAAVQAGLRHVEIHVSVGQERFPSVEEFVRQEAASSPLAAPLAALDGGASAAMVEALRRRLALHVDDTGLAFQNETHILVGRAPSEAQR